MSVSLTNFHGATEEQYQSLVKELDSFLANPEKYKSSIELYKYVVKLKKHKILTAPQIYVYIEEEKRIMVSLSEKAYEKIKHFTYRDLHKEQKKVILQLDIIEKEKGIYYAEKINSVTKVDGASKINGRVMEFFNL